MDYRIYPPEELIEDGVVTLPASKSILNRRLVLDMLTPGVTPLAAPDEADECDDIRVMRQALGAISTSAGGRIEINVGESATALRFLTAVIASQPGCQAILTGLPGVLCRPVGDLVEALKKCGATIDYVDREGYAPLRISGGELVGGEVLINATVSSQFISALMLVAPRMNLGLKIRFDGEPASLPYIKMTAAMMQRYGAEVELLPLSATVKPGTYHPATPSPEADWSAASFWYEVVALTAGWVTLRGEEDIPLLLPEESIQGDAVTARYFESLGVLTQPSEDTVGALSLSPSPEVYGRLDLDLYENPDLAPALTVTCCMLGVPFKFTGLGSLSIKECDRLQTLVDEMDKVGCRLDKIRDYGIEWEGKRHPIVSLPEFDTHADHRMAMAFAPVAAYIPGIVVKEADCVAKSYPGFWDALRSLGFRTVDPSLPIDTPTVDDAD
ncbi:MAG: 3-phosphoshikimate 1-carboxyvinyltransferase [Muribaculaceae bacterium]|nr:3-phosphoshikimate 1-carboxyvinyltransferase [Muribaculaceae bacterium]